MLKRKDKGDPDVPSPQRSHNMFDTGTLEPLKMPDVRHLIKYADNVVALLASPLDLGQHHIETYHLRRQTSNI